MFSDRTNPVVPSGLNVGDLLAITDGLDVVGRVGGVRPEQGSHALAQAVAHWTGELYSFMIMIINQYYMYLLINMVLNYSTQSGK